MATVVADTIEGSQMSVSADGFKIVRGFMIKDVTGNADVRQKNALMDAGIPAIGAAHPGSGLSAYKAASKTIVSADNENSIFRINVAYELPTQTLEIDGDPIWSVGASLESKATNVDINDAPLVVTYDNKPQTGTVDVLRPNFVLRAERRESADPTPVAAAYDGYVNSDTFKGFAAGTLLCTRVEGTGNDESGWNVNYEFQYNPLGWLATVAYQDENGVVPSDVTDGDGLESYEVYAEIAFSGLGL